MKKTYAKPQIAFESFIMSTNIAGDCETPFVTTATRTTCYIPGSGGMKLFATDGTNALCNAYPPDGMHNGLCYHNPSDDANLFNS